MSKPNVIVIMCDQMKATASHLYGNVDCHTPGMERMANEGVLFQNAFTPHPLCVPARCAMWTGQWPHTNGCRRNETFLPVDAPHAIKTYKDLGYTCGLIGKNHAFMEASDRELFDVWCEITHGGFARTFPNRGMDWVRPIEAINAAHATRRNMPSQTPRLNYAVSDYPLTDYSTGLVAGQTGRFIEQQAASDSDNPFCLWVSFPDPHTPFEAPRQYADMFPPESLTLPPFKTGEFENAPERNQVMYNIMGLEDDPEDDLRGCLSVYYAMTRFVDDGVSQILDTLDRTGLRENTIVVFTADHGDLSGEHGMFNKGGMFYDCLTHVPMIVSWPGHLPQGSVDESMVNLVDIVPTLFTLQGIDIPDTMEGQPLPTVTEAEPRDVTFSEYGAGGLLFRVADQQRLSTPVGRRAIGLSLQWREAEGRRKMARTRKWKYVHDPMGDKDELYDLVNDPWELTNVVDDPACSKALAEMRLRLADWAIMTEDGRPVPLPNADKYNLFD